jgi:predicted RNase H-like HicB family nuclease
LTKLAIFSFCNIILMGVMKLKQLRYKILLRSDPEGGYTVTVPSLPGCVTYGSTIEEAIDMAKEAIELYIESLKAHGEEIPVEDEVFEYTLTISTNA